VKKSHDEEPDQARREVVLFLGSFAAAGLFGCSGSGRAASESAGGPSSPPSTSSCVVRPQQTEGPFFVDERLNRSDIRADPTLGLARAGVPLRLGFLVSRSAGSTCMPLAGVLVDVWHCDATGAYSDLGSNSGTKFLRGYQATDAAGAAQFTTIYPGWYNGRAVHIHFKIRNSPGAGPGFEFTSQLYFDDALTDLVYAQPPYNSRGRRDTTNQRDGIFAAGGSQLLLPLTADGPGYAGTFDIALQI